MNSLVIPIGVMYAGLAGALLALIVAAAVNGWSLRVFFLLALRLAIGWQFMFEGLYKINTYYYPSENTKPFTSEPYFKLSPGPIGDLMRKQFSDPAARIAENVKAPKEIPPAVFAKLPDADQAAACPAAVASQLDSMEGVAAQSIKSAAEKQLAHADADLAHEIAAINKSRDEAEAKAKSPDEKEKIQTNANADVKKAQSLAETKNKEAQQAVQDSEKLAKDVITSKKAAYARWVYGVDGRNTKVKFINNEDPSLSAPNRMAHIEWLRQELKSANEQLAGGLGNGYNIDTKRVSELRMDLIAAESQLAKDSSDFVKELKKDLNGGNAPEEVTPTSWGQRMDIGTMWFLTAVGGCLLFGLFTRPACVLAAGFLVMTYLAFPPFPWYPVAPNTEGNPLFINKNAIECLALLALACMPTGRWLGLDALVLRPFLSYQSTPSTPAPAPLAPQRSAIR